tara:strand:- start:8428 stop:16875 length:8448 start_codon:yes stop_codon:yes gene_type:complete
MPQYRRLPNGQILELPDNLTQEQIEIVNERYFTAPQRGIESLPTEEDQDTSILGQIVETGKAVPRGFTSSLISSGEGIVSLFDKGNDSETLKKIRNARKYINEESFLAADDAYKDKFLTKFGEGLGSFATFATPGVALKVAGAAGKTIGTGSKIAATATGFGLAGTAGVSQQADQMETSKAKGIDISTGKEVASELAGLGIGFTEMLPIFGLLSRIPGGQVASDVAEKHMGKLLNKVRTQGGKAGKEVVKEAGKKGVASTVKRASRTAGEEAIQETVAGLAQELAGKGIYDSSIQVGGSAWDDFTVGGAVGFASDLLINAIIPGKQKNKVSAYNNEQKHEEETERVNKSNNPNATEVEYDVVEVGGKSVNEPLGYQVVEKNSGVVVSPRYKRPDEAINQKTILDNQKNEASLLLTTESNANDQGRSGDAQGKVAIIQANSDNANKVSRSEAQTIIVPQGATEKKSINDQWQSHINKKIKGKSKKAQNKRQKYIYGNSFTPAELLADKIITKKQYNETMQNKIDAMNIKKPSASTSDLNKTLKSKNIDEKIGSGSTGSTNFHSYLKALTGKDRWTKLNDTEKKYVNARIKQLPKANKKRKMIDTTASKYSLENINTVIETQDNNYNETGENQAYTIEEIQKIASTPNKINKDATNQMVERLVDSGRLTKINSGKDKGKYKFFKDRGKANAIENETQFQKQNLMDSEAFFETQAEFKARLSTKRDKDGNALLTPTEINQIAKNNSQKKVQDLGLGNILADEELLDFDGVVQDKEGRYRKTTIQKSTTDGLSKRERLSRAGLSAEEGSTVRKEKNKARLKSLIEKELKKKGLDKLGISAAVGKIFAKKDKTGFFDVSEGAGVYIPSLGQVVLNYDTFLDILPQNLDSLSDKQILSRKLILKDKDNQKTFDTTIGGTINHESIHALKDLNLFTQKEWVVLSNYVKNTKDPRYKGQTIEIENNKGRRLSIENPTYLEVQLQQNKSLDADGVIEEAIAEAFGVYTRNPNKFSGMPRNLFQRILDTLTSFFTAFDSSGLTANEIFSSIQEGDLTSSERLSDATMDTRPTELTEEEEIKYQRFTPAERQFIEKLVTLNDLVDGAPNGAVRLESMDAIIDAIQEQADRPRVRMTILPRNVREIVSSYSGYIRFNTDNSIRKRRQNRFGNEVKYQRINAETQPLLDVGLPYSEIGYQLDEWFKANGSEAENASIVKVNNLLKKTPTRETLKLDKTYLNDEGKEKTAFKNFAELKQSVQEILDEGNFDPNWYLKVGQEAEAIVGKDNMVEFSVLWAITSASTDPELNFQNTLEVMSLARGIDPKTGNKKHKDVYLDPKGFKRRVKALKMPTGSKYTIDEIGQFYEDANWTTKTDTSIKTPIYGLTTLMVKDGEYMPFMVADRWMYRTMGFTDAITKRAPKRSEIHYAQYMVKKLGSEQYTYNNGKNTRSLRPDEIQAALWFSIRNNSGNKQKTPGTIPSILEKSKKTIDSISFAKEKNYWSDVGSFINKDNLDLNPYERITYVGAGKFGTLQMPRMKKQEQERASKLFIEVNPGNERGYGKLTDESGNSVELTYEQVDRLTEEVMDSITDENGKINLLKKLGIPHQVTKTHGAYEGGVSPSYVIDILGQRINNTLLSDIAKTLGDALMQDAVVTTQTNPDGKRPASLLSKKVNEGQESAFTNEEITLINDAINSEGGISNYYNPNQRFPLGFTAKYINDSILIIDEQYNKFDDGDFSEESEDTRVRRFEEFQRYIQERLSNIDGLPEIEYSTAYTDGNYINDYTEATSGIRLQTDTEGSSDIQNAAVSDLYIPAWRSFTNFIQNEGLTTENNVAPYENAKTTALTKAISPNEVKYQRARAILQEANDNSKPNTTPRFNLKTTSPLAQTTVLEHIENEDKVGINPLDDEIKFQRTKKAETILGDDLNVKTENIPFGQRAIEQLSSFGRSFRFIVLDKLEAIERSSANFADKAGQTLLASTSAIGAARLGERVKGIIQETLTQGGVPYYDSASVFEGGTQRINKTFVDRNGKTQSVHLLKAIANNVDAEGNSLESQFQEYAIYRRMKALTSDERKNSEFAKKLKEENNALYKKIVNDKQNLFEQFEQDYPQTVDLWEQWQSYNDSILEYARDAGILSDELAEYYRQTSDYIPFYKAHEDLKSGKFDLFGEDALGNTRKGVEKINDKVLTRKLDQSFAPTELVPAYEAMLGNTLSIMQVSAKNITRQRLAREQRFLGTGTNIESSQISDVGQENVFMYKENGQEQYMQVNDKALVQALESYNADGTMSALLNIVGFPSTVLREFVTRDPGFMAANLLRDTISAYATSGANFIPIIDSVKGLATGLDNINRFGIVSGYDLSRDALSLNKFIDKELKKLGVEQNGGVLMKQFFTPMGIWDRLGEATTRSDAATRQAVYKKVFEATGDQYEAAYQALEVINFNRRGANPYVRIITTAIPFLNARMQGLDVLYRAASSDLYTRRTGKQSERRYGAMQSRFGKGDDELKNQMISTFLGRMALLSGLTAIYWLMVSDDEDYKNLTPEQKDNNFFIPIAENYSIKIPIAFEVGVLTKVIPERTLELTFGDDSLRDTKESVFRSITQTLKIDPLNFQIIAPLREAIENKNKFTGRPIESYFMEKLEPGARSMDYTNELLRVIGEALNISPMKLEHIAKGYTGTIGGYILALTDNVTRTITGTPKVPFRPSSVPFGRFVQDDLRRRGLQNQYYDLQQEVDKVVATINSLKKKDRWDKVKAYRYAKKDIISIKSEMNQIRKYMKNYRNKRDRISRDETLSNEVRKKLLDELEWERDQKLMVIPLLRERANLPFIDKFSF